MVKSGFRVLFLVFLTLLVAAIGHTQLAPTPSITSIDLKVITAKIVAVGKVEKVSSSGDYSRRIATFSVGETLKGEPRSTLTSRVTGSAAALAGWQARASRLLIVQQPDADWSDLIDLDSEPLKVPTKDFSFLGNPDDVLRYVREVVRLHPASERVDAFLLRPPENDVGRRWREEVGAKEIEGLRVPPDARVEQQALDDIRSSVTWRRSSGVQTLGAFRSDKNIALLKALLTSPDYWVGPRAEDNRGVERRYYGLRQQAFNVLRYVWHLEVPAPVIEEDVSVLDKMETAKVSIRPDTQDLDWLAGAKNLKSLDLSESHVPIGDRLVAGISRLEQLNRLDLSSTGIQDRQLWSLGRLRELRSLNLDANPITDQGLAALELFPKLEEVSLAETEVSDRSLRALRTSHRGLTVRPEFAISAINRYARANYLAGVKRVLASKPGAVTQPDDSAWGNSPLHNAVGADAIDVARYLLQHGAPVDARNRRNETPLQIAATNYRPNLDLVKLLIRYGAHLGSGEALRAALDAGGDYNFDLIRLLLACGEPPPSPASLRDPTSAKAKLARQMWEARHAGPGLLRLSSTRGSRTVYRLSPSTLSTWTTKPLGPLTGPLSWSKTPSGRPYLGPLGQQSCRLKLPGLPKHENVELEMDLFVIGSWDGNGGLGSGPDILQIRVEGEGYLLNSTFFNNSEGDAAPLAMQSFPDPYPFGFHKGFTGATAIRKLGFHESWAGHPYRRDAVYHLRFTFPHSAKDLSLDFRGLNVTEGGMSGLDEDERWGIGKLVVKVDSATAPDRSARPRPGRSRPGRYGGRRAPAEKRSGTFR